MAKALIFIAAILVQGCSGETPSDQPKQTPHELTSNGSKWALQAEDAVDDLEIASEPVEIAPVAEDEETSDPANLADDIVQNEEEYPYQTVTILTIHGDPTVDSTVAPTKEELEEQGAEVTVIYIDDEGFDPANIPTDASLTIIDAHGHTDANGVYGAGSQETVYIDQDDLDKAEFEGDVAICTCHAGAAEVNCAGNVLKVCGPTEEIFSEPLLDLLLDLVEDPLAFWDSTQFKDWNFASNEHDKIADAEKECAKLDGTMTTTLLSAAIPGFIECRREYICNDELLGSTHDTPHFSMDCSGVLCSEYDESQCLEGITPNLYDNCEPVDFSESLSTIPGYHETVSLHCEYPGLKRNRDGTHPTIE